ncbi:MAG: hypothetical protein Q9226_006226 [Calogaya cf. arnoldii]
MDDLATTRKAGAKYFHELFKRPDCTLDGPARRQLQNLFSKESSVSRNELQPDALAEVEKWESMTPAEGTAEYDKARVRLLRDYLNEDELEAEFKKGLITGENDNRRAKLLEQSEFAHDGAEKSQLLGGSHRLYQRRSIAPTYNYKGKIVSKAKRDEKELDDFWGYDDASEEEGGVGLQEDEQDMSGAADDEDDEDDAIAYMDDDVTAGGVALNTERDLPFRSR